MDGEGRCVWRMTQYLRVQVEESGQVWCERQEEEEEVMGGGKKKMF